MSSPDNHRRRNTDVTKLIESGYEVKILDLNRIVVKFYGPKGTPYEGGVWKVQVDLLEQYPFLPPGILFLNKIYHPNIGFWSGWPCLNVIDDAWTEKYNLSMMFEYFLPQLLTEPNPDDALNDRAANLFLESPEEYKKKITEYVQKYATEEALQQDNDQSNWTIWRQISALSNSSSDSE